MREEYESCPEDYYEQFDLSDDKEDFDEDNYNEWLLDQAERAYAELVEE